MKKIIAGALAFLLVLTLTISQAFAITTAEKEQNYKTALEELENYIQSVCAYPLLKVFALFWRRFLHYARPQPVSF